MPGHDDAAAGLHANLWWRRRGGSRRRAVGAARAPPGQKQLPGPCCTHLCPCPFLNPPLTSLGLRGTSSVQAAACRQRQRPLARLLIQQPARHWHPPTCFCSSLPACLPILCRGCVGSRMISNIGEPENIAGVDLLKKGDQASQWQPLPKAPAAGCGVTAGCRWCRVAAAGWETWLGHSCQWVVCCHRLPMPSSACCIPTYAMQEEVRRVFAEMAGGGGGKKEKAVGAGCWLACFRCAGRGRNGQPSLLCVCVSAQPAAVEPRLPHPCLRARRQRSRLPSRLPRGLPRLAPRSQPRRRPRRKRRKRRKRRRKRWQVRQCCCAAGVCAGVVSSLGVPELAGSQRHRLRSGSCSRLAQSACYIGLQCMHLVMRPLVCTLQRSLQRSLQRRRRRGLMLRCWQRVSSEWLSWVPALVESCRGTCSLLRSMLALTMSCISGCSCSLLVLAWVLVRCCCLCFMHVFACSLLQRRSLWQKTRGRRRRRRRRRRKRRRKRRRHPRRSGAAGARSEAEGAASGCRQAAAWSGWSLTRRAHLGAGRAQQGAEGVGMDAHSTIPTAHGARQTVPAGGARCDCSRHSQVAIHKLPFTSGRLQLQLPFDSLPTRLDMHLCTHVNGRTQ